MIPLFGRMNRHYEELGYSFQTLSEGRSPIGYHADLFSVIISTFLYHDQSQSVCVSSAAVGVTMDIKSLKEM